MIRTVGKTMGDGQEVHLHPGLGQLTAAVVKFAPEPFHFLFQLLFLALGIVPTRGKRYHLQSQIR